MRPSRAAFGALVAGVLTVWSVAPARADWYSPSRGKRKGMVIGFAVGGAVMKGVGDLSDIGGVGPSASLRVGTVATSKLLWLLTLDNATYLVKDQLGDVKVNQNLVLTLGGQYFLRDALWLRAGVGLGGYARRAQQVQGPPEKQSGGLAFSFGLGVDVWFRDNWVVNLELVSASTVVDGGLVSQGGLMLALSRY